MIKLPRLLKNDGSIEKIINPIKVSIKQSIVPLSMATITLPIGEDIPARRYVELFNPYGSAGVFRVLSPRNAYGDEVTTIELEHAVSEVGDYLVKAEYSDMYAADTAMKNVFSHYNGSMWRLGSVADLGSGKIALEAKYTRVLDSMLAILNQKRDCMMAFDFSTKPWTINIVKKETIVSAEGRLSRNVESAVVAYDDSELCTRVYYQTFTKSKNGDITSKWNYKDADTKGKYGTFERDVATSSDMTIDEINFTVDSYLEEHKNPKVSIDIKGLDLFKITGENMDKFIIGKLFRLTIPEYSTVVENNITEVSWDDVYNDPQNVNVKLGEPEDTVVSFIHNIDTKGSGGGGSSGRSQKEEEEKWKEYRTNFVRTDYLINMNAQRIDRAGNILEQAGLDINSQGVLIYANTSNGIGSKIAQTAKEIRLEVTNTKAGLQSQITQTDSKITQEVTRAKTAENSLSGRIDVQADKVSLVVEEKDGNNVVKAASIVAGINNQSGTYIKLSADKINLSGYVTASQLSATDARIDNLVSGNSSFTQIVTAGLRTSAFRLSGADIAKQTVTIDGTTIHYLGW